MNGSTRRLVAVGPALALALLALGTASPAFAAGPWYVATSGSDSADCLSPATACASVGAVLAKPGFAAGDVIQITTGTYTGSGIEVLRVDRSATLSGGWDSSFAAQVGTSTIDGAGARRGVSVVGAVTVVIERFTIQNGYEHGGGGGGIRNEGTLTVRNSVLTGNVSPYVVGNASGGGIWNASGATLTVDNTTIKNNRADLGGGGLFNVGAATITDSTIDGNTSGMAGFSGGSGGAGIQQFNGTSLNIIRTTISNNTIVGDFTGSGIEAQGPVSLVNSTVTGNTGGARGEGIYSFVQSVSLQNTTVAGNERAGIVNLGGSFTLANSLLADNGTSDCYNDPSYSGTINSLGHNLVENNLNCTLAGSDLPGLDPRLRPLASNGGPTKTLALGAGSPALDNGSNALVPGGITTDQRGTGFARILDASDADTTDEVDIGALEQHPSLEDVTNQTIDEDSSLGLSFNLGDADLVFDSVTAVSSNTSLVPNNPANISLGGSGSSRTLTVNPVANLFGSTTITLTVTDTVAGAAQTMTDTFVLTVNPVADTPSVTNASTNEDTQTSSGLVVSRNPADGAEVTHFKITNITNGTLFKHDGTTQIPNNGFITFAEANAGLKFTPATNLFSPSTLFGFEVQASTSNADGGLAGNAVTASITVAPVADTPSVTNASTTTNTQTTSGLVISRNAADGTEVTHFKITNITNGTLFQPDGTTPIPNNDFIPFAQGNAGLRFTPANGFAGTAHFTVRASTAASDSGLGGSPVTADISVGPPTAVTVTSFTVRRDTAGRVIVRWRTSADARTLGCNLWRRVPGSSAAFKRINRTSIPAWLSTNARHSYAYVDRSAEARRAYVYKLQIVNLDGTARWAAVAAVRP